MATPTHTRGQKATAEQRETAAQALLTGHTTTQAANAAGVTRQTISKWRNHDPEFRFLLNDHATAIHRLAQDRLTGLIANAVDTLADICKDPDAKDADRLNAAKEILARSLPDTRDPGPEAELHEALEAFLAAAAAGEQA